MIVGAEFVTIHIKTMDHSSVEVGDEELLVSSIESDGAKTWPTVGQAIVGDVSKQRDFTRYTVNTPD